MAAKPTDTRGILREILLPYQLRWLEDQARFKIGMWSRQTGKSFGTAAEAVCSCVAEPGVTWVVLSAGERQALEWMAKARQWAAAFKLAVALDEEIRTSANAVITRSEIRFAGGSRIVAIPANPDTARGYSANLILDEFAIHERPWDIWAAIYPSITNPLTGLKRLRVVSTPKGRANKFYDLWTKNDAYSKHKVTILDAAADGLPVNVDELKAGVDDPDIWAQEYLCEFIDSSAVLLPYELIAACEADAVTDPGEGDVYMGYDVGRRKDLSVLVTAVRAAGVLQVVSVETFRAMPFHEQLAVLKARIGAGSRVRRCCIDSTGIGAMLAEEARRFCGPKAQGVDFTAKTKAEMYSALRRAFEDRTVRVPCDRELREDLHAVVRNVSSGGAVTYSAPRNEDGHSDRAAALALCLRAAAQKAGPAFMPRPFSAPGGTAL
jgi:phage FluMu gp28-like protein